MFHGSLTALITPFKNGEVDEGAFKRLVEWARQGVCKLVIVDVGHFADPGLDFCEEVKSSNPHQKVLIHAEDRVFPVKSECPDDVIPKQDGPLTFVKAVERMLQVA